MSIGIYKITNIKNNKCYIGQSINIEKRFYAYKELACSGQPKIYNALKKYNINNFKFEIIFKLKKINIELLNKLEIAYISYYNSNKNGYNIQSGGKNSLHTIETKNKISISRTGKCVGLKFSEERKKNISESNLGKKISNESKLKMREAKLGKKHSKEHLKKMSINNIGKHSKKILQFNKNGEFIKEWDSLSNAGKELNILISSISQCCSGNSKTAGKYIWKYKN